MSKKQPKPQHQNQPPQQGAVANIIFLPDREDSTDALKLFLACEIAKVPYGTTKTLPGGVDANGRYVSGALIELVNDQRVLFDANAGVRHVLSKHTPRDRIDLHAQIGHWMEWEAGKLAPAVGAAKGVLTPQVRELLMELDRGLVGAGATLVKDTKAADIVVYSCLCPLTVEIKKETSIPAVTAWWKRLGRDLNLLKGLQAWKKLTSREDAAPVEVKRTNLPPPKVEPSVVIELRHHQEKILPKEGQRNILITSALPYVNNVPHLGNIIGCVLSADVYARFCRLRGYNTLYVCGTDEHGTATETKALEEGVSCQELCDKYHALHRQAYDWFCCDFDYFGRTTTKQQTAITQEIFLKLEKNGHILEDTITQLYCEKHSSFLADRFVEGVCPLCGYEDARGDQCDKCGKLLNPIELINPRCKLDGATPVPRTSKHLFLNLTEQQPKLEEWIDSSSVKGAWSANTVTITKAWLKEGLKPRCITRDLKWGVPVPKKGFEDKVFYVWFDAPIGYPSITANYTEEWEKWWKNPDNVQLYQFMGKDNVPFHTVIFPSSLIGTSDPWTLLHHISTTEYLHYEGEKFSKSRGVGVFGNNASESGISADVYRYYLLSNRPETSDSQFTWAAFADANNGELLYNLGNLVNRVVKFLNKQYDGAVPGSKSDGPAETKLHSDVNTQLAQYVKALEEVQLRTALKLAMSISAAGNLYLAENKIDNKLFTNDRDRCDTIISYGANLVYLISALVYPYMPNTSASILRQLNLPQRRITEEWSGRDIVPGHVIGSAEYLFKPIDNVAELKAKYSGNAKAAAPEPAKGKGGGKKGKSGGGGGGGGLLNEAPAGVEKTPEIVELEKKIKEVGETVRKLKAEKAVGVEQAVAELLEAKKKLTVAVAGVTKN
ncbi:hypothetical protein HK104_004361 [Borealophlyctis nickersoniae]|nr:hypothetical protein HK104_004361 [Borealophlyctis nickersoniae]